jgi:4-hydroxy-tetrahydrodipicolinate synthase
MEFNPFNGVYTAVLSPLQSDGRCDVPELAKHCQDLIHQGCKGIVLFGTSGEGPSFTLEERKSALKELINHGVSARNIILCAMCSAIEETISLTKSVLECKCAGVLILPPFFYKNLRDEEIIGFYREVIKRVDHHPDLKILLYHIPQFSGVAMNLNIIKALYQEFPQTVIGIKESEGNRSFTESILDNVPGFKVFVANESLLQVCIAKGAVGGISGLANIWAPLLCEIYENANQPSKQKKHRDEAIEAALAIIRSYPLIPALKALLANKKGDKWESLRHPLLPLHLEEKEQLIQAFARLNVD